MGKQHPEKRVEDSVGSMMRNFVTHKYSEETMRLAVAEMVILDEFPLPFRVVEGQRSKKVCWSLEPLFKVSCHVTIERDCMKLFVLEKEIS